MTNIRKDEILIWVPSENKSNSLPLELTCSVECYERETTERHQLLMLLLDPAKPSCHIHSLLITLHGLRETWTAKIALHVPFILSL
jgi:hypothetical protein